MYCGARASFHVTQGGQLIVGNPPIQSFDSGYIWDFHPMALHGRRPLVSTHFCLLIPLGLGEVECQPELLGKLGMPHKIN